MCYLVVTVRPTQSLLLLLYLLLAVDCCIIIIFYPRQSLFSEHTRIQHVTLSRDRRSLDILSVKKEAKLCASEIPGVEEGKGDGDLRCRGLLTVCQRSLGLPTCQEMRRRRWSSSVSWL